jgi:RNA polymerase sigma factor (TIGR02999 family)
MANSGEVTRLLKAWSGGDTAALQQLAPVVEGELRLLARAYLSGERAGHALQPTALINEAYLRLLEWKPDDWRCRAQFYAVAAKMMRRILANHAIAMRRQKRGGARSRDCPCECGPPPPIHFPDRQGVRRSYASGTQRTRTSRHYQYV